MRRRRFTSARRRFRRLRSDRGITIIEVGVAMMVMSVAVAGVIGSMGAGLQLVGHSRQRSAGSGIAQERIERIRNLPYANVALCVSTESASPCFQQPQHVNQVGHPDHDVTTDNSGYRVNDSTTEPLIVDSANGAVRHVDDPLTLGKTEFSVYQYVMWHDDPSIDDPVNTPDRDYKRVVVVVTWKFPVQSGTTNRVVESTFVGPGGVIVPAATPLATTSPTPAPSPTPPPEAVPTASPPPCVAAPGVFCVVAGAPQPTANPSGPCPADTTAPAPGSPPAQVLSQSGADQGYTNSTTLQLRVRATDDCAPLTVEMSNDFATCCAPVITLVSGKNTVFSWTIPSGDGDKYVYLRFRDGNGRSSETFVTRVILDQTRPLPPGNLRVVTCNISTSDRAVSFTWDASTDPNLFGYRLYVSLDSGAFQPVAISATTSVSDTRSKSFGSVRYLVRAYDKAGNESTDSNVLSFSKNSC